MKAKNPISRKLSELGLLVTDQVPAMLAYWDRDLICRFANNAYLEWFGKSKEEMIDKIHISELLGPVYEKNLPYIQAALSGKKQLFEREILLPDGKSAKHSLATYIPDFQHSEVIGFFVHVADVTYIKNLEKEIADVKREMLRSTILRIEKERKYAVEILRESINQRLVACKMMIQVNKNGDRDSLNEVNLYIGQIVNEINAMCEELTPTEIETLGMIPAIAIILKKYYDRSGKTFQFKCEGESIEDIDMDDKVSIFRIVQAFAMLTVIYKKGKKVQIEINYNKPQLHIQLISDSGTEFDPQSKEYKVIIARVEYFAGQIIQTRNNKENLLDIKFLIPNT